MPATHTHTRTHTHAGIDPFLVKKIKTSTPPWTSPGTRVMFISFEHGAATGTNAPRDDDDADRAGGTASVTSPAKGDRRFDDAASPLPVCD